MAEALQAGDHDRLKLMAVLEHLELCGLRFFRKPPRPWHSTPDPRAGAGKESS